MQQSQVNAPLGTYGLERVKLRMVKPPEQRTYRANVFQIEQISQIEPNREHSTPVYETSKIDASLRGSVAFYLKNKGAIWVL